MRRVAAVLCLLAASLLLPPPALAEDAPPVAVIEDAAGDAGGAAAAAGRSAPLDLLALEAQEDPAAVVLRLKVAALDAAPQAPMADAALYRVHFAYGGVAYQVRMLRGASLAGPVQATLLADVAGGSAYEPVLELEAFADPVAQALVTSIPRTALVDQAGAPAFAGRELAGFWAEAQPGLAGLPGAGDRAPDAGASAVPLPIRFGLEQSGDARLASAEPFRASNGEAATFRYVVQASNLGERDGRFALAAERVPPGWTVRLPAQAQDLAIAGGSSVDVEVLAEVPFAHTHGRLATFSVSLTARSDAGSVGRLLLGILYTEPAQPAGHHDTLVLHSRTGLGVAPTMAMALGSAGGGVEAYMNTLVDDPSDAGTDVPPAYEGGFASAAMSTALTWMVPLSPALALGLDFDLDELGEAHVPFVASGPLPGAVLSGAVLLHRGNGTPAPGDGIVLAELLPAGPVEAPAGQATVLDAVVQPLPAADYVRHAPGQGLWLQLTLTYARPDATTGPATPLLRPGGTLRLPLLEYSDAPGAGADTTGVGALAEPDAGHGDPARPGLVAVDGPDASGGTADGGAKGAPAPGLAPAALAVALAAVALRRRRA